VVTDIWEPVHRRTADDASNSKVGDLLTPGHRTPGGRVDQPRPDYARLVAIHFQRLSFY
jgi:hypothetical protein